MIDEQLKGIAMQALNLAKADLEHKTELQMVIASYIEGEGLHRMRRIEALIGEKLGQDWLNHAGKKEMAFGVLRQACSVFRPDALVTAVVTNSWRGTERLKARNLSRAEMEKLYKKADRDAAVRDGLLVECEELVAMAQSPERVCIVHQAIQDCRFTGAPEILVMGQEDFQGTLKVFGKPEEKTA